MNYNHSSHPRKRWRVVLFIVGCLLVVCGIVYMKRTSTGQKLLSAPLPSDTASRHIAIPDTTIAPDLLPPTADSLDFSVLPDTLLGKDKRDPYEAGYEDGYGAGCDDGAAERTGHRTTKQATSTRRPKSKTIPGATAKAMPRAMKTATKENSLTSEYT